MVVPTHSITLCVMTNKPEEWTKIFGRFTDLAKVLNDEGYSHVSVTSSLLDEDEVEIPYTSEKED